MTVAFAPARGARWGSEYCETHIDAHFGVYQENVDKKTGEITETFHGLVPPEHKNPGRLYEDFQVRELRKWAPVRTYHGDLTKGVSGPALGVLRFKLFDSARRGGHGRQPVLSRSLSSSLSRILAGRRPSMMRWRRLSARDSVPRT